MGQQLAHPSGVPISSAHSPAAQDPAASPQRGHIVQPASLSRPGSATPSQSASVMSDMTNAMMRPAPASPGSRPGHTSSARQPDSAGAAGHSPRPTAASSQQPIDRRAAAAAAAAAAALTGPPKGSTAAAHVPQLGLRVTSTAATHLSPPPSSRGASPFERAAATLPPLAANGKGKQASSPDNRPADVHSPASPQGEAAVPTSPPVTTPVRKPPGLPSPVPAVHGQGSADLDSVISSDRWPDQVSTKSETSSNPCSPKKGIKVPAVVPPLPLPTASASASAVVSEAMSETASEDGSSLGDRQSISSSQPLDQSAAAIAARLERERAQQRKQEAKHLASKQRAALKRQQDIADQDRRQQEEHAWKAEQKAKAIADKAPLTAPGLHPLLSTPFDPPASGIREPREVDRPRRGPRDFDDAASQQAPKSYPTAGVRHVPAHAGPRHAPERHNSRPPSYGPPDSDYGSDYGSDFGGSEHEAPFGRSRGKGRAAQPDRSVKGAGSGAGRIPMQGTLL